MSDSLEIKRMQLKKVKYKQKPQINVPQKFKPSKVQPVLPISNKKRSIVPIKKKFDNDLDHIIFAKEYQDFDKWPGNESPYML